MLRNSYLGLNLLEWIKNCIVTELEKNFMKNTSLTLSTNTYEHVKM